MKIHFYFKSVFKELFIVLLFPMVFCGCTATKITMDKKVSLNEYKQVYFIPPEDDPRKVTPKVVSKLEELGFNVKVISSDKSLEGNQGTGFIVSNDGHILTCAHVLGDEQSATVWLNGIRYEGDVINKSKEDDLALIKTQSPPDLSKKPLYFNKNDDIEMGQDVFTIGYPLSELLGNSARLSKGLVSATSGIKDDPNYLQISAEIQPGNSGSPLLDDSGLVIGVVEHTLDSLKVMLQTDGALPQNVNFALKGSIVIKYLEEQNIIPLYKDADPSSRSFENVKNSIVKIRAGIIPPELEDQPKLVVTLKYISLWDMWYRFKIFHLEFYDFDTEELLFTTGQYSDTVFTSEDDVIKKTFDEVREKLLK